MRRSSFGSAVRFAHAGYEHGCSALSGPRRLLRWWAMSDDRQLVTAAELDAMSPDERAAAVSERIVTNLDELSPEFRERVLATGRRLAAERSRAHG